MLDIDTYNDIAVEEKGYRKWEREERNRILNMTNTKRKQVAWNDLFPRLAIEGLSEKELNQPY